MTGTDVTMTRTARIAAREILTATATLRKLEGNARPYFSVTGDIRDTRRRGDNAFIVSGCIHEEIGEVFPELLPLIALHLSDDKGTPMHAVENGLYFLGLQSGPRNLEAFARLWRVGQDDAERILAYVTEDPNPREALRFCARDHEARWLAEANDAIAFLKANQ